MAYTDYFDKIQEIYIAYYQRPADPEGLIYWAKRLDAENGDLKAIIEAFANSPESQALYGNITKDNIADVVKAIYEAAFNREPEQAGLQYYVNGFKEGKFTPATIMLNILDGATGADKVVLENKIESAMSFTKAIDPDLDAKDLLATYDSKDIPAARDFLKQVTADPATVKDLAEAQEYVKEKIADPGDPILTSPVANLVLTPQLDTVVGTKGDDVIKAPVVTNAAGAQVDTLNTGDIIDGKDGNDKLVLYTLGKSMLFPSMNNVEELDLHNIGTSSTKYFMDDVNGLKTIDVAPTNQTVEFYDLNNLVKVVDENRESTAGSYLKVNYLPAAVSGDSDTQEIVLKGAGNVSSPENIKLEGGNIENVNISSEQSHNYLKLDTVGTDTIKVSGDKDINLTINSDSGVDSYTVDASELKGDGVFDVNTTKNATIKGGSGDDKFVINSTNDDKYLTIDGGSGNDVLDVSVSYKDSDYHDTKHYDSAVSNVEKVTIDGSAGITVDLSHQSEGFEIVDNNKGNTIYGGKGADTIKLVDDNVTDNVVLNHPFAAVDKVTDFESAGATKDKLYIDLTTDKDDKVGNFKFGADNAVDAKYAPTATKKLHILQFKTGSTKVVGTAAKSINKAMASAVTLASAAATKNLVVGKEIHIDKNDNNKITYKVNNATKTVTFAALGSKDAVLFFYDSDDHKLEMFGLHIKVTAAGKTAQGLTVYTHKTLATVSLTGTGSLSGSDIYLM